jgi:sugar/nucleoside kinase (ribokinase family)
MKKVFILGGTTFDHIVHLQQLPQPVAQTIHVAPFYEATGSTGSGKALHLTKLGVPNTLYSVLGNDVYGNKIIQYLKEQHVDLIYDFDAAGTERHFNIMDDEGNRISMFITQSSEQTNFNAAQIESLIKQCDMVVLNIIGYCKQFIPIIKKFNKPVWTDLHDYDGKNQYHQAFIEASQYIHLSSDNLPDYKPLMQQLINDEKEIVICTHAKQGATVLTKDGKWYEQEALTNFNLVDANGAGDGFFSGFLFGYLQQLPVEICLQYGTVCAAYCITSKQLVYEQLSASFLKEQHQKIFG